MKLQDFLKDLFSQDAVEGYEIGRLEVDISVRESNPMDGESGDGLIFSVGGDKPCAKIIIIPKSHTVPLQAP